MTDDTQATRDAVDLLAAFTEEHKALLLLFSCPGERAEENAKNSYDKVATILARIAAAK